MRLQPMLMAIPLLLAGCACNGASGSYVVDDTYAAIEVEDSTAGSGDTYVASAGGYATADYSNPCAPCAPQPRTIYHDAGPVFVDHVHGYREIHRHSLEVTREDQGCVDCPPGVNPGVLSR